ncbi:hypothetical protein O6H91_07G059500 [Diphasiastrum complanatum]|uniref:Uncharacterized protein n=1 Tax=Diphasiastrum complanatum TaxID=34168 RepID=A0ACC2D628_DIPCM|nr:hypothetical protein O6H91_07G059500 [Diphasiastrum complanatum]
MESKIQSGGGGATHSASEMEVDIPAVAAAQPSQPIPNKYGFNLLHLIKTAQAQHGLKHGDYKRYRGYCTARLRRLYKSLKFTHGRGKYVPKPILEATVTSVRFLHVVLYSAERAWSSAMEIKQTPNGANSHQRAHLIRRLSKAAKWGDLLERLCSEKADPRTALEAAAYASYMRGNLLLEREANWENALRKFKNARAVYEELGKYGDVENQVLCRQRVEELDPSIRYCLYKMGRSNMKESELLDLSTQEGPGLDLLQGKLEAVMAEARLQQAVSLTELEWLGHKFPVKNEKTRVCILKAQEMEKDLLSPTSNSLVADKKFTFYDKIFMAYQDAKRHIRDDLVTAGGAEDMREDLIGLDKAVSCILLQRTIERNSLLVSLAKNRLRHQQGLSDERTEKPTKPEELVRLYDLLIQNITDLSDLATSGRERRIDESSYAVELAARRLAFQAERCFYLAQSYSAAGKFAEAYVLFHSARGHADSALQSQQQLQVSDKGLVKELRELSEQCRAQSCLVHAWALNKAEKAEEKLQKGVASLSLKHESSRKEDVKYLLDYLDKYEAAISVAGSKEPPRIVQVPPPFTTVPCRPIVLDTALNAIDFPSLEGRLKKEDKKKGFLGKWWGS